MILSSLFFVLIMLILLYWALIPMYCTDLTECRLDSTKSTSAYNWFIGVLFLLMIASSVLTAINCPSENKILNVVYAIFSTIACWAIFAFVVYSREYMRMSFANVFGYLWVSKKANEILAHIIPTKYVDITELMNKLSAQTSTSNGNIYKRDLSTITPEMIEKVSRIRIDDNFELLTYLRSGSNYIPSLEYVKEYTNKIFREDVANAIPDGVKENKDLIELLNVLYTRDIIGEFILFILAGVMCSYLTEYLIKKINCNYKTKEEIDKKIAEYDAQYNQQQQLKEKSIVVTM